MRHGGLCVLVAASFLVTACSGPAADSGPSGNGTVASGPPLQQAPTPPTWGGVALAPAQVRFVIDKEFSANDLVLRAGIGIYDPTTKVVHLGLAAKNVNATEVDPPSTISIDTGRGEPKAGTIVNRVTRLPFGVPVLLTVQFADVAVFDPGSATLVIGDPRRPIRKVSLAPDRPLTPAESELPRSWPIDRWGSQGKYTFHFTEARISSRPFAGASGVPPELTGNRVMELTFDLWASGRDTTWGFKPAEHVRLRRPDGRVVEAIGASTLVTPYSYSAFEGLRVQFPVDPSLAGDHTLLVNGRSEGFTQNKAVNLAVTEVPFPLDPPAPAAVLPGPAPEPMRPTETAPSGTGPSSSTPRTAPPGGVTDVAVAARLSVGGLVHRFDHAVVDLDKRKVTISGTTDVVAIRPPAGDGALSIDTDGVDIRGSFSLSWGDNWVVGRPSKAVVPWGGGPIEVSFDLPAPSPRTGIEPGFAIERAGLAFAPTRPRQGGWADTITVPLGTQSTMPDTASGAPLSFVGAGESVVTGPWTTRIVRGRVGALPAGFPAPPGWTFLELEIQATLAANAKAPDFVSHGQTFLGRPDGYQSTAEDAVRMDAIGDQAPGTIGTYVVLFEVPTARLQERMTFLMRSLDESFNAATGEKSWVEGNLTFTIPPEALAPGASPSPEPAPADG